jgi:hypothetical protein
MAMKANLPLAIFMLCSFRLRQQNDWIIVPGKRLGPITRDATLRPVWTGYLAWPTSKINPWAAEMGRSRPRWYSRECSQRRSR